MLPLVACSGSPEQALEPWLVDATAELGLAGFRHETGARGDRWFPEALGAGVAFLDFDLDGWSDLLLVRGGALPRAPAGAPMPAVELFRNAGGQRFERVTEQAGLGGVVAYGMGVTVGDPDGDGDPDFLLTTLAGNLFLRNDGGVFREVAREVGLAGPAEWTSAAVFLDADRDGWLDLFVGGYVQWSPESDLWCTHDGRTKSHCSPEVYPGLSPRFYRNLGGGRFQEETALQGLTGLPGKTLGAVAVDFDRDGWSDLYVSNDTEPNLLLRNRAGRGFEEVGVAEGVAFDANGRARAGMGVDAGVVDETGEVTLFVGNFSKEMIAVFRRRPGGGFEIRDEASPIGMQSLLTLTFGLFLADLDLDGDLDLLVANGHIRAEEEGAGEGIRYRQPAQLFLNDGAGHFEDVGARHGGVLAQPLLARGAAYADWDRDGDLDVALSENGGAAHLWRNRTIEQGAGRAVRLHLRGRGGNRDAFGSRLELEAGGRRQLREVRSGGSYLSSSELTVTFGLGELPRAEGVRVTWPDGRAQELGALAAGSELEVRQEDPAP